MPILSHSSETESIVGIQFGVFSPDEIKRRSVVEVTSHSTQDGKIGGLADPRMGVLENGKLCRSCGLNNHQCPGHFGHYALARPVYYIQFYKIILKILRCVCIKCGKLLVNKDTARALRRTKGENRWKAVLLTCQDVTRCGEKTEDGCGARQPHRYHDEDFCRIVAEWKDLVAEGGAAEGGDGKLRRFLEPEYVYRLLRRISDEDVDFLGFSRLWCRPDWLMCSVLPIPPPQVRPSVLQDNNQRSEDDLTQKLIDIIKTNIQLNDKIAKGAKKKAIDEYTLLLQWHIATLVDNELPGMAQSAQRSGRPLKSLSQRLGTKEGRIRNNLQGKRVEFSARSVITPDPNISVEELGVPMKVAMNLTFPERVTAFNIDRLYALVQNGPDKYPGAKSIQRSGSATTGDESGGRMISLKHVNTKTIQLFEGDVVNRHLLDGDPVLFNRQPSLHRMSMMCHRVRVLPYSTFRLNVSVTKPYNADFDGDEMNMHVPQSVEAATELREIAAVPKQMISPKLGKPLISVVQDTLVGVNRLTRPTEFFSRREFMNLLVHSKRWDGRMPEPVKRDPVPLWSGQQVVSALLPAVYLAMGNKMWDDTKGRSDPNYVIINNGDIKQGILDGDVFDKALIHILYNDFSPEMTVDFLDSLQAVVATYLQNSGFSVGLSDIVADSETLSTISAEMGELKKKIESLQLQVHMGLFDNTSGRTNQEEFEGKVFQTLDKVVGAAGKTGLKSLAANNRMVNMVKCGSKGSDVNIAQMIATLGQQSIEGKRIAYGFQDRTLPHFKRYDDGAEARGFIESSFVKGLNPAEFFFHAMTGREGLIDTAVKTADSGYMYRQLVKTMEDMITYHDGTVRDAGGILVQFAYGDDGTNATKIENQPIRLAEMSDTEIRAKFTVEDVGADKSQAHLSKVFADRDMLVTNVWGGRVDKTVQSAVHLPRLIATAVKQMNLTVGQGTPVTGAHVLDTVDRILERTRADNRLWAALLRYHMNPRDIQALGFTRAAFDWLAEQIIVKHLRSWAVPGEMVGIIAAQSIGETTTQMSSHKETWISVKNLKNPDELYVGPVGHFIDRIMDGATEKSAILRGDGDSEALDLPPATWAIMGVSDDEKTSWKPISQVSRHPANGGLVKVTTKSGRTTTATLSHSFLRRTTCGLEEIKGSDLRVGHRIPVAYRMPEAPDALTSYNGYELTKEFGWLMGIYLADGSFSGNTVKICKIHPVVEERIRALAAAHGWEISVRHYTGQFGPSKDTNIHDAKLKQTLMALGNTGSFDKTLAAPVFHANREFIAGVLSGYFDGDGNVNAARQQIRVGSRSKSLIRDMGRLLAVVGVFASIKEERSVRIPGAVMHTLNVIRKHADQFQKEVGFYLPEKAAGLAEIVAYNHREGAMSLKEEIDMIPELGDVIAETGLLLKMPGQSRLYGCYGSHRVKPKTAIGRRTLETYIREFREMMTIHVGEEVREKVLVNLAILESAVKSDIIWDEITELETMSDPHELVYDFTIPGNDSFLVDDNIFVHNTLNTFHLAGVAAKSGMTRGVPRLKELLKVTQNPKATSLTIFLRPDLRKSKEDARRLAQELEFTTLKDLVTVSRIYYDPRDSASLITDDSEWLSFFAAFEADEAEEEPNSPWILRLELDRERMFNKNITMEDINYVLRGVQSDLSVAYTDHNASRMVFRIRLNHSEEENPLNDLGAIKALQNKLLTQTLVRGVPGLRSVSFRKMTNEIYEKNPDNDNKYEAAEQFVLDTFGTNFVDVLIHPDVDGTKLISNHIHDIYENLGIEAARQLLFREVFTLFEQAAPVNYRHVAILCDSLTNRGRLMSADRIGVNKKAKIGPLAKASFEQTQDIILRAALFGDVDPVTGVSANIMTGQPIRGGTSFSHILLDEAALKELIASAPPPKRTIERAPALTQMQVDAMLEAPEQAGCRQQDLRIPAALPPMDPTSMVPDELPELEISLVDE
jgi:DNA-directed RNA polymerase II subunit RPB1